MITGIPRSGTSYITSLLHNFSNSVMLSEPPMLDIMHKPLDRAAKELFDYYYERVLNHKSVTNKFLSDGTLSTDTRTEKPLKNSGVHEFDNNNFVFGIKNTRTFLARLPGIIEGMPDAKIVVLARNPFDTIGSMRRFAGMGFGPGIHKLAPFYKNLLGVDLIEMQEDPGFVVWMWRFWTDVIIRYLDDIIFIRYQDLVLTPAETLDRIIGDWNMGKSLKPTKPSEIRYSRECMRSGDKELVEKHCKENAEILGVW